MISCLLLLQENWDVLKLLALSFERLLINLTMLFRCRKAAVVITLLGFVPAFEAIPANSFSENAVHKRDTSKYVFAHFMVRGISIYIFKFLVFLNRKNLKQEWLLSLEHIFIGRNR